MGGLIGAGLAGLLFGHGFWGGMMGFGGFLGFLLQILLLVLLARWLIRLFRGPSPIFAGAGAGPGMFAHAGSASLGPTGASGRAARPPIALGPSDYREFEQSLQEIQAARSAHDVKALGAAVTPEMLSYFAEQTSRSVRNEVTDVRLLQGDLAQAWTERGRDYVTVAMRFSMIDVTRDSIGRIVAGSPTEPVSATELWTFVRGPGGRWILRPSSKRGSRSSVVPMRHRRYGCYEHVSRLDAVKARPVRAQSQRLAFLWKPGRWTRTTQKR
jgi:predicted lipid-binding transport protein (Tim44 family)